jgi:hypothetical protein
MPASPERVRDLALQRNFGITLAEYRQILAAQGGMCPICKKPLSGWSNPVDHDHKTGVIRGILCTYCNRKNVGHFSDWKLVFEIYKYLLHHPAAKVVGPRRVPKKKPRKRRPKPPVL